MGGAVAALTATLITGGATAGAAALASQIIIGLVTTLAVSAVSSAFFRKKPQTPNFSQTDQTLTFRSAAGPRKLIYGETRTGGEILAAWTTGGNEYLHLVIEMAGREVDAIGDVYAADELVPLDSAGNATGRLRGFLRVKKWLGSVDQLADPDLVAEIEEVTEDDRWRGIAALYVRLRKNRDLYPTGVPNFSAVVRGHKVYDPREAGQSATDPAGWTWSRNAILCLRDYVNGARLSDGAGGMHKAIFGLGAAADQINGAAAIANANACAEQVAAQANPRGFTVPARAAMAVIPNATLPIVNPPRFDLDEDLPDRWQVGYAVRMRSLGTPPAPLVEGAIYHVIPVKRYGPQIAGVFIGAPTRTDASLRLAATEADALAGNFIVLTDTGTGTHRLLDASTAVEVATGAVWNTGDAVRVTSSGTPPPPLVADTIYYPIRETDTRYRFAATVEDALAGTAIIITDTGDGDHTGGHAFEPRYNCDGIVTLDQDPESIIGGLLSASGGRAIWSGGEWLLTAAAAAIPTVSIGEDDLTRPITFTTKSSTRELFNAVKGLYVGPANDYQLADFPAVENATYEAQDGGEQKFGDIELEFTASASAASRLAKIELEKARQQIVIVASCKLTVLRVRCGDVIRFTDSRRGWAEKEFEVIDWRWDTEAVDGVPYLGIKLTLKEWAAAMFDWNSGEQTIVDPAPNTNLPNAFQPLPATGLDMREELYRTRQGSGFKSRAVLSWQAPDDAFVARGGDYIPQYRLDAEAEFTVLPPTVHDEVLIPDLLPGIYVFTVQSRNSLGVKSDPIDAPVLQKEIFGLGAAPGPLTGVSLTQAGGTAGLRWDLHPELDVREGGAIEWRHSPLTSGATWPASTSMGRPLDGYLTAVSYPLKAGTYLARVFDAGGVPSKTIATVTTKQSSAVPFADIGTVIESPTFPGTHIGTAGVDGVLKLSGATNIDDWPDFDAVADIDLEGGLNTQGEYLWSGGFRFWPTVKSVRVVTSNQALVVNSFNTIDQRTGNIDDWEDFDGVESGSADAWTEISLTDDDPLGASPQWTPWQRADNSEVDAAGIRLRTLLFSFDPAYNIELSQLSATVAEVTSP